MKHNTLFKHFIPVLLICAFLCNSTTAFALAAPTDAGADASSTRLVQVTEDDSFAREEALSMLGMTEEEANGGEIYLVTQEVSVAPLSTNSDVIGVDEYREYPAFTFHTSNTGRSFGVGGDRIMYAYKWRWLNAYDRNALSLHVRLMDSRGTCDYTHTSGSGWGDGSLHVTHSPYISVSPSYAYHFVYTTSYSYTEEETPAPYVEVTMAVYVDNKK